MHVDTPLEACERATQRASTPRPAPARAHQFHRHRLALRGAPKTTAKTAENAFRVAENDERERPDRVLSDFEQSRRLQEALAELPADQRGAFLLRVENGLGIEEIGEVMGVGRETAKSRLRYALEKLRAGLRSSA
jgi:RNA polymerase sigma-70 factor (ECF subfamily)